MLTQWIPVRASCLMLYLGLCCAGAVGCQSTTREDNFTGEAVRARWLSWVEDGRTSRADVVRQLGEPTRSYEGGRVVAYHLYLRNPGCKPTRGNFRKLHARGFGQMQPDTQLLALHRGPPSDDDLDVQLSPATFGLVLVYEHDLIRAHALLRSF